MESRGAFRGSVPLLALLSLVLDLGCEDGPRSAQAPTALEASDGLAAMQRHIAEREYRASPNGQGLQAPNRRHNLRTYFGPSGIRVHDRTAAGSPELLGVSLVGLGRGETLAPVAPGVVTSEGARVEIRRLDLLEWYVNSPAGLEQGFTLPERPDGEGALALELAVAHASAALRGERVILATPPGRRLEYGKLAVVDATGAAVAARLEVPDPGRVRLVVADADARYPLTIDPLLSETADTQLESDQASANLGISVSGAGDVNGDFFDDVIVGAHAYDAGQTDEGAAFVFLGGASGIADGSPATASAQLESDQASALLGSSVSGAGDVNGDGYADVIVGARLYDAGESNEGAAFVFLGSASGIADGSPATAATQLESNQASAFLGWSVSDAGDVNGDGYADVIVGAINYDAGENDEGAAFVFLGSASGIANGNPATASAQLESDQAGANLGYSVSGAGDVDADGYADAIVGAYLYDAGESNEGAAFVFLGSAAGIADGSPATAAAQLESDQADAWLGYSVSGAGDADGDGYADVIVGAWRYNAGESQEGAAFVFPGSASGIADGSPATAATQLESDQAGANLGIDVSGAGDVNGDGYSDVIVGAHKYNAPLINEGAAFVFLGSASGIADGSPATAAAQLESDQTDGQLGISVSGAGDVNGDGYSDVIVGANTYDAGQSDEGAAFVFLATPPVVTRTLPFTGTLEYVLPHLAPAVPDGVMLSLPVNGDAIVRGPGAHVSTLTFATNTVATGAASALGPFSYLWKVSVPTAATLSGVLQPGGVVLDRVHASFTTPGGWRYHGVGTGAAPAPGTLDVCRLGLCDPLFVANFPLSEVGSPGPFTGVTCFPASGCGITQEVPAFARFNFAGAQWGSRAALRARPTPLFTFITFENSMGFAHGPSSRTSTAAATSGVIQFVAPSMVAVSALSEDQLLVGIFSRLTLRFLPEPGVGIGLGCAAALLALLGRRRARRRELP